MLASRRFITNVKLSDAERVFELRYRETINPDKDRWELCAQVLGRRDIEEKMSKPW
jgi:hypothetical protein